jgi:hypothetical protein
MAVEGSDQAVRVPGEQRAELGEQLAVCAAQPEKGKPLLELFLHRG